VKRKWKLVRQSQMVQSVIYGSDAVVTQVLTPAVLYLGSQLGLFPFAHYERTKTWQDIILAVRMFHVCVLPKNNLQLPFVRTVLNLLWYFILSFIHFHAVCNLILLFSLPMYATRYLCFHENIRKMCIFFNLLLEIIKI